MLHFGIKRDIEKKKRNLKFNLAEVIIIMIVTAICAITLTIKVTYTVNNIPQKIKSETDLSELISIYDSISDDYYEEINKEEMISSAIEAMVNYLDDPYSTYLDAEEAEALTQELNGEYEGIGAKIKLSNNKFSISEVFENSPSEKAGLKVDDVILKIGETSVSGKTLEEISELIKEKNTDSFTMTIKRNNKETDVTIKRAKVDLKSVQYRTISKEKKQVGIITISVFAKNTYAQFKEIVGEIEFNAISALIIDLRNNKGGYLTTATSIAEMFLNKNDVIYQTSTKNGVKKIINKKNQTIDAKVVLLVNSSTASASEILAAALKENINSEIVGVKTYGKGKVQQTKTLSDGSMVKFTIENWLTPIGEKIDQKGIEPTVEVKLNNKYYKNPIDANDLQLQKALELAIK